LGGLPRHFYLIVDNTCSSNKNQIMMRFFARLIIMNIFESATLLFPVKGHTHGPLDGIGGHAVVKCSCETFQSADELVHVYQKFLRKAAFEKGTFVQDCYKHDDSAIWTDWCGEVPLQFSHMTGPLAPHGFRFLRWKHVKLEEVNSSGYSPHDPCGDDVMCLIYEHMSDPLPFQMAKLLSNLA
jgi:hypothetical protein